MQDSKVLTAEEKQLEIEKIQADKRFVGHPVGVLTIGLKFMCNSFSYYGLTSILIYYLYAALPAGLGLTKTEASQLLSLYYALVIICGVIGSYMADRVFGPRMAIRLTCIVMPTDCLSVARNSGPRHCGLCGRTGHDALLEHARRPQHGRADREAL